MRLYLPDEWSYSIAGRLTWINLIYEVINEAIVLPLYFFMGSALADKKAFANRIIRGLLVSFGVYSVCSVLVAVFIKPLLRFMAVSTDILDELLHTYELNVWQMYLAFFTVSSGCTCIHRKR